MKYIIRKAWENVYFTAQGKDGIEQTVELNFNRTTLDFSIEEAGEEGIRFNKNTLQEAYLKIRAIKTAKDGGVCIKELGDKNG